METKKLECDFHVTEGGNEPVREWLKKDVTSEVRKEIGDDIRYVQTHWPIGKPYVDGFGKGLFEVRTSYDKNIFRVLFHIINGEMILLHGLHKKTGKTPNQDVALARDRQRLDVERLKQQKGLKS